MPESRIPTVKRNNVLLLIYFFFKDTKYIIIPNLLARNPFGDGFLGWKWHMEAKGRMKVADMEFLVEKGVIDNNSWRYYHLFKTIHTLSVSLSVLDALSNNN